MPVRGREERWVASLPTEEKFFGIALFVLDSFLGALALRASGSRQTFLAVAFVVVLVLIVLLVWWMRINRTFGENSKFAEMLATDICEMFEGAMRTDRPNQRVTEEDIKAGYDLFCEGVRNHEALSKPESRFVAVLVTRVRVKAEHNRKRWAR